MLENDCTQVCGWIPSSTNNNEFTLFEGDWLALSGKTFA